ncbi:MAG TPA: SGNH/GDSL hydrolase family protein [Propionibacteriaceae bacterium]|nr:SGNH/GDSL hydrolase family protein [Propionibacteriaceae bacterium]
MSARGRFLSGLVSLVIALAGLVTVGALPAAATNSGTVQYVALGDSYAAGQGAPPYLNDCLQSNKGYPGLLDSEKRIHLRANEACTGATISDVANTQLSALNRGTRLVTLTVGATELNVSAVATACLTGTLEACQREIARVQLLLGVCPEDPEDPSALDSPLTDLYAQLVNAAPNALVVVTGYPQLFELIPPNEDIKTAINDATTALNCVIERAVTATEKATGADIVYVDVTSRFMGHGIGSPVSFINATGLDAFHPNAAGYLFGYTAAISAELPPAWLAGQTQLV